MYYKNARIFGPDLQFHTGAFQVKNGRFAAVLPASAPKNAINLQGATVIPGLVDLHIHGCQGADLSRGSSRDLTAIARHLLSRGITAFLPTAMSLPARSLDSLAHKVHPLTRQTSAQRARILGLRLEGPYLSPQQAGSQESSHFKHPDREEFLHLWELSQGTLSMVDLAPELPGAMAFVEQACKKCTVSLGHTQCDYETAREAFSRGATHMTHLFNAMSGFHHRAPGLLAAAVENPRVCAELICDGVHIHPAAVRLAFSLFGGDRMILVSDAGAGCGLPEGSSFSLSGRPATVENGAGYLPDGTLACSTTDLYQGMVNAIFFGVEECDAIRAATYNPARVIGMQDQIGSIAPGRLADFIICRRDYTGKRVFLSGKEIH